MLLTNPAVISDETDMPLHSTPQAPHITHTFSSRNNTFMVTNTATSCHSSSNNHCHKHSHLVSLTQQYVSKEPPYTIIVTNTATSRHSHTITSYTINVTDTTTFTSHMNTFAPSPTQPPHVTRTITHHKRVNPMPLAPLLPSLTL